MSLRFSKVREVKSPTRGTALSAGIDFFIPEDFKAVSLGSGQKITIPCGIHVDLIGSGLSDYALVFFNKSGVASKKGLIVGACVVDADYQGEMHINLINTNENESILLSPGDKIVQGIILPVEYDMTEEVPFEDLYAGETERGAGGFGSTGVK